jgi:hypothetical protein
MKAASEPAFLAPHRLLQPRQRRTVVVRKFSWHTAPQERVAERPLLGQIDTALQRQLVAVSSGVSRRRYQHPRHPLRRPLRIRQIRRRRDSLYLWPVRRL